ncbi:MAG: hypothetical protein LBS50_09990 [Prevotellaceae bacterium]|jgi:hypothetical protein|nr:hypothetical protein [Prevotellaceae bacterium]
MIKKTFLILLASASIGSIFTSCDNTVVVGEHEGSVVFWYSKTTAEYLVNRGVTTLKFYVDNEFAGSQAASMYWNSAPECGQNASTTVTKDLGSSTSKSSEYVVKDQNENVLWQGLATFTDGVCQKILLKI